MAVCNRCGMSGLVWGYPNGGGRLRLMESTQRNKAHYCSAPPRQDMFLQKKAKRKTLADLPKSIPSEKKLLVPRQDGKSLNSIPEVIRILSDPVHLNKAIDELNRITGMNYNYLKRKKTWQA